MSLSFGPAEAQEADRLIALALAEDIPAGDVTSEAIIPAGVRVRGGFAARSHGVICGIPVVERLFAKLDAAVGLNARQEDGEEARPGVPFLEVSGPAWAILAGERTALNFLQRLSGIATRAHEWSAALTGSRAALLDTRKTSPGWRRLEKYAVRAGGGSNHRASLSDQALVKDNHVLILRRLGGSKARDWVGAIRRRHPGMIVEVEVDGLEEFREAIESGADIILLDNMKPEAMAQAVRERDDRGGPPPLLEASGGIDAAKLREVARSGVERISSGALTHSAVALDIGFDLSEVEQCG